MPGRESGHPRAGADAALGWSALLESNLERLASELTLEGADAGEVHEEIVRLFIQLAFAGLADAQGGARLVPLREQLRASSGQVDGGAWRQLMGVIEQLDRDGWEGQAGIPTLSAHGFSDATVRDVLGWLDGLVTRAADGIDGAVRELGALHELLLGLRLQRLSSPARRLRRSGAWLEPRRVLAWEPSVRAKRLQRELGLSKHSVQALGPTLARLTTSRGVEEALASVLDPDIPARNKGRWVLQPSLDQRRRGAHYTPWPLCMEVVERTLGPIVDRLPEPRSSSLLELKLCDPAMGAGAFLIAATHYLAQALVRAWHAEAAPGPPRHEHDVGMARRLVAERVITGVDKNPAAVNLSRLTLTAFALGPGGSPACFRDTLRLGDALVGSVISAHGTGEAAEASVTPPSPPFDWSVAFPDVFGRHEPGFDAVVGNPPWVAYVGRAAQPLGAELFAYYVATNPAFKRYRTLHGLFVYRSATLLRGGGRLGLVLPTSVADLDGYRATRDAHDSLCDVDYELPDWGDGAFSQVFQPSMALLSTRRPGSLLPRPSRIWRLHEDDIGTVARGLLQRLRLLPRLPPELFGERGFQTTRDDQAHLRRAQAPEESFDLPLREGADLSEFCRLEPHLFADPRRLSARLRPAADWQKVALLVRQTARFPIAAHADGLAFRNSILACFEHPEWKASLLVCFLNSGLARWLHYTGHRDARQGMPQLKVGHLRSLPALPANVGSIRTQLEQLGAQLGQRNQGLDEAERLRIDELVNAAFGLSPSECELVERWASAHRPPVSRRKNAAGANRPVDLSAE